MAVDRGTLPVPKSVWKNLIQIGIAALCFAAAVQLAIESTPENLICVSLALVTPVVLSWVLLKQRNNKDHPIPLIAVHLFLIANMTLPLVVKTLELEPLTYNLAVPLMTYGLTAVGAVTLTLSYIVYVSSRSLARFRHFVSAKIYTPFCLFRPPTDLQLWMMGGLGAMATVYVLLTGTLFEKVHHSDVTFARFMWGFTPFAYAPFLILARHLFTDETRVSRMKPLVIVQFFVIIGLGMGLNGRSPMLMPLVNLGVWLALGTITGITRVTRAGLRNFVIVMCLAIAFAPLASDLATAMVLARSARQKVGAFQIMQSTVENLSKKSELEHQRAQEETQKGNDIYVHNEFLSRFIDIKFLDLTLDWTKDMTPLEKRVFTDLAVEKAWDILPTPVAGFFGIKTSKDVQATQKSFADFLYDEKYGSEDLVSHRAGNVIAIGLVLHDIFFFPLFFIVGLVLFPFFDAFLVKLGNNPQSGSQRRQFLCFSPLILFNIYLVCGAFLSLNGHDSEIFYLAWIIRDLPQMIILYFVLFKLTGWASAVATLGVQANRSPGQRALRPAGRTP